MCLSSPDKKAITTTARCCKRRHKTHRYEHRAHLPPASSAGEHPQGAIMTLSAEREELESVLSPRGTIGIVEVTFFVFGLTAAADISRLVCVCLCVFLLSDGSTCGRARVCVWEAGNRNSYARE